MEEVKQNKKFQPRLDIKSGQSLSHPLAGDAQVMDMFSTIILSVIPICMNLDPIFLFLGVFVTLSYAINRSSRSFFATPRFISLLAFSAAVVFRYFTIMNGTKPNTFSLFEGFYA